MIGRCLEVRRTDLKPVDCPPTRLIVTELALEHLHHEPLTPVLDAFFEERLNLLRRVAIRRLCKRKLARNLLEIFPQQLPPLHERFLQKRL